MKMKISIITIIISMLIILSGCSSQDKPEKVVGEFSEALKAFDLEKMSSKINPSNADDKEVVSNLDEEVEGSLEKHFIDYVKANAKKIKYDIEDSKVDDDKATVSVKFKYVDGGPLFKATFGEYMQQAFALAFTSPEMTDEEASEMLLTIMKQKNEEIEETFTEKTIDIKCVKVDDEWYIDDLDDDITDVMTSNMVSIIESMDDSFNFDAESNTVKDQLEDEDLVVIEKGVGDDITLSTIDLKVNSVEETKLLESTYGDPVKAKDGTKFVLVSMDITNTTKTEITAPDDLKLIDNEDREFSKYSDSIGAIEDYLDYRDLAPSIKESGRFVYELPEDSTSYSIVVGKADTDEIYKIKLK